MQRNDSQKKATDQPRKRQSALGSATTPSRKPTAEQLLLQLESEQKEHNKHFQEMRSYYEAKLVRFDAMQIRYMAAREHQETLIARIKKLENDFIEMRKKKELIEVELKKKELNEQSTSDGKRSIEPMNESARDKCKQMDKEIKDVKEHLKRAEENLVLTNEMVEQRDKAIIEFGKRISSLKRLAWKAASNNDQAENSEASKSRDSSWDSDSEFLDLLVVIDEVADEEGSAGDGISNTTKENLNHTLHSDGRERLTAFQKRKMTIEHQLSQLSSSIESLQKNLLLAKSELKEKSAIECDLRQNVAKLQRINEKLKGECEQLKAKAVERPASELTKLMERLRDLETVSENAVKSAKLSNNAFIRMDLRKNQYREIVVSSIDEIDQLCGIFKRYLDGEPCTPEPGVDTNVCTEVGGHMEVSSGTRDSDSKITLSAQKAITAADIPLFATSNCVRTPSASGICTAQRDGCKITDSSFLSDCSIATLEKTCFVEADTSMQPETCKKLLQKRQVAASDSVDSVSSTVQRNENRIQWLSAKRPHQRNNS
uniref:Uncharacterized protein n=1 Tax=Parascaris univalens TaxID=6257 RepID=A0A915B6S7_PARUN